MQKKYAYIFDDEDKAIHWHRAVEHGGIEVWRVGNAVFTDERVYSWVKENYLLADGDDPIWMSDNF